MVQKIPATVITGFLGAGKTTLIRHILQNANGKRIALIINEFGDLGVDGDILKGCNNATCSADDIIELSNGCICCTVADDFIPTMQKILARSEKPDHIIIETSGLALPQPLVRAFNWPEISTKVTVDSVITVVDAKAVSEGRFAHSVDAVDAQRSLDENLDHETPLSELFEDQITSADMIIVNKSDLLDKAQSDALVAKLKADSRDGVQVIKATMGALPIDVLLGQKINTQRNLDTRHEHHHHDHDHDHDEFISFVIELKEIVDIDNFCNTLLDVIQQNDILRLKGFAAILGKPMRLTIQAVGPRIDTYFDRLFKPDEPRITRFVVIGKANLDQDAIRKAFIL